MEETGSVAAAFTQALRSELTAEQSTALRACLDCRQCGTACAWYLGTADPALHPKHKTDFVRRIHRQHVTAAGRLKQRLGLGRPLQESELREALPAFWKCTTCGRCTLACPLGLSNRSLVRLARAAFSRAGLVLDNPALRQVLEGSRDERHSFALPRRRIHLRVGFLAWHAGIEIPYDVPRTEHLFLCSAVGNARFPDLGLVVPALLNAAGVDYSFSSRITDTGTDAEHVVVHRELSRAMLLDVEAEALRLGARTVVISECGCDTRTFYVEAAEILGRPLRVTVQALDSLLLRLVSSHALPVRPVSGRITLHDPCKVTRLSGFGDLIRELLARVAAAPVEMSPNRERNYCCNGGTGPLRLPENDVLRRRISSLKADQIRATGAGRVATPCAVCMLTLEDVCQTYGLGDKDHRTSFLLAEIVHEAVVAALRARGEEERLRRPAVFRGAGASLAEGHSMAAQVRAISRLPTFAGDVRWLRKDPVLRRYLAQHPGAGPAFETWLGELGPTTAEGRA